MSQSFEVNGKKYLPSNDLAATFGYTSDYIGKLAREEKIIGTQVGRQWFIEPESLNTFLLKTKIEKEIRKSELSAQRKVEHALHRKTETSVKPLTPSAAPALLQTIAVLSCGLFVGGLSWIVSTEQLHVQELAFGVTQVASALKTQVIPREFDVAVVKDAAQVLIAQTHTGASKQAQVSGAYENTAPNSLVPVNPLVEIFATLPLADATTLDVSASSTPGALDTKSVVTNVPKIANNFSDEIKVVVGTDGETLIAPVFKSDAASDQFFRLVPVDGKKK